MHRHIYIYALKLYIILEIYSHFVLHIVNSNIRRKNCLSESSGHENKHLLFLFTGTSKALITKLFFTLCLGILTNNFPGSNVLQDKNFLAFRSH